MKLKTQNSKFKTAFSLAAAGIIACAALFIAHAGLQVQAVLNGGTNNILPSAANTYGTNIPSFYCGTANNAYVEYSCTTSNRNAITNTVSLDTSVDNVNWQSNAITHAFATTSSNGSAQVFVITNCPPFFRVEYITNNASDSYASNFLMKVFIKPGT